MKRHEFLIDRLQSNEARTDLADAERNRLRDRYAELFGEETRANNKPWLVKRIAWRLQALAEGDLSERALQRAAALAIDADLRMMPHAPFRWPWR